MSSAVEKDQYTESNHLYNSSVKLRKSQDIESKLQTHTQTRLRAGGKKGPENGKALIRFHANYFQKIEFYLDPLAPRFEGELCKDTTSRNVKRLRQNTSHYSLTHLLKLHTSRSWSCDLCVLTLVISLWDNKKNTTTTAVLTTEIEW